MIHASLSHSPIHFNNCYQLVADDTCGGINAFIGNTRKWNKGKEVQYLEFESYEPMAIKEMEKIGQACMDQFSIQHICIQHRLGKVQLEESAVIIIAWSKHRDAAFAACRYAIDTLKETVPIWKKEVLKDGSYWVNSRP